MGSRHCNAASVGFGKSKLIYSDWHTTKLSYIIILQDHFDQCMNDMDFSISHNDRFLKNWGLIHPSTFRLVRYVKMFACTCRKDPRPQKVRIWWPRTSATSDLRPKMLEKFFFDFLDELSNFKHFETNFFFGLFLAFWPSWRPKGQKKAIPH